MRQKKFLTLAQGLRASFNQPAFVACKAVHGGASAAPGLWSAGSLGNFEVRASSKSSARHSFWRSGVTWALPASQRQDEFPGIVPIDPDDFIHREKFSEGPFMAFKEGRLSGLYQRDPRQETIIIILQDLYKRLRKVFRQHRKRGGLTMVDNLHDKPAPAAWWSNLANIMHNDHASTPGTRKIVSQSKRTCGSQPVQGLYMYGGVGVGKTMLMDLFVFSATPEFRVHRTHFHSFMLEIHSRLRDHAHMQDPLVEVADDISKGCRVLALDEFFVTDVADAMVLHRLFDRLWDNGLVLIATSNRAPDDLYEGGLQRDSFLPFIDRLKEACNIHDMESTTDYRKLAHHQQGLFFLGTDGHEKLENVYKNMAGHHSEAKNVQVEVQLGRVLTVPRASGKVCYFTFNELCGQPVGPADYIALAQHFHSICLEGIPEANNATRSDAYRFVMLIDVLYDHRIRLACSAFIPIANIFDKILTQADLPPGGLLDRDSDLVVDDNLGFAKNRTLSRLTEMQSMEYLVEHSNKHAPELLLALAEAQAKESGKGSMAIK